MCGFALFFGKLSRFLGNIINFPNLRSEFRAKKNMRFAIYFTICIPSGHSPRPPRKKSENTLQKRLLFHAVFHIIETLNRDATVAQSVEQLIRNQQVAGSSPASSSTPPQAYLACGGFLCLGIPAPTADHGSGYGFHWIDLLNLFYARFAQNEGLRHMAKPLDWFGLSWITAA